MKGINFIHIFLDHMKDIRTNMDMRFEYAKTVQRTRSFHQYVSISENAIGCKRMSGELDFDLLHELLHHPSKPSFHIGSYVVCSYDGLEWVGLVCDIDKENGYSQVKFMYPHYPSMSYKQSSLEDLCWIPPACVLVVVEPPLPTSVGVRQYKLSSETNFKLDGPLCMMQMKSNHS